MNSTWTAWATPSTAALLTGNDQQVMLASSYGLQTMTVQAPQYNPLSSICSAVWGTRLALLRFQQVSGYRACIVDIYSVQGTSLCFDCTVTRVFGGDLLQISPDGKFCAAVTAETVSDQARSPCLALICLNTGSVREFSVPQQIATEPAEVFCCWSADGMSLLLQGDNSPASQLIAFAEL